MNPTMAIILTGQEVFINKVNTPMNPAITIIYDQYGLGGFFITISIEGIRAIQTNTKIATYE